MGGYGDVKRRTVIRLLKWLANNKTVEATDGGRHTKVMCIRNGKAFPVPTTHQFVNKHILKAFMEWCVENEVCTKEEFEERL